MIFSDFYLPLKSMFAQYDAAGYGKRPNKYIAPASEGSKQDAIKFERLEKGCLLWIRGEKYPIRGDINEIKIRDLTMVKKIIPLTVKFVGDKDNWFKKLVILIGFTQYWKLFVDIIYWQLEEVYSDVNYYSQPVRELWRVIKNIKFRDIICAVLENDLAYRYRVQDVLSEINYDNLVKNPLKEIERLLKLMFERETDKNAHATSKFSKYLPYIILYLRFNKKLLNEIKDVLFHIDKNEIKLSIEDIYWTNIYTDYNFRGIPTVERTKEYETMKNE